MFGTLATGNSGFFKLNLRLFTMIYNELLL